MEKESWHWFHKLHTYLLKIHKIEASENAMGALNATYLKEGIFFLPALCQVSWSMGELSHKHLILELECSHQQVVW